MVSDRNTSVDEVAGVQGLWTTEAEKWLGGVAWNDNYVTFESDQYVDTWYRNKCYFNTYDNIFADGAGNDTYLTCEG